MITPLTIAEAEYGAAADAFGDAEAALIVATLRLGDARLHARRACTAMREAGERLRAAREAEASDTIPAPAPEHAA